jgi:hypothetical protein
MTMTVITDETTVLGAAEAEDWSSGVYSGISWGAVIAGAFTAVAVAIIVIALGSGIGMAMTSPYSFSSSPSASTMTIIGALWLVFAQAVGFAVGGYVAGRLRRGPAVLHTDEVRFRDGANGLIVWAIGVVLTFFFITAAVTKVGSAAGATAANTATAAVTSAAQPPSMDYFTDMLFRPSPQGGANGIAAGVGGNGTPAVPANNANAERDQVNRIMLTSLSTDGMSNDDRAYLAQLVSARTGLGQDDARHRVDDVVNRAKQDTTQAVDKARKAAAYLSFWTFMSLLFGAACGTLGGILGGDLRDDVAARQAAHTAPR